MVHARQRDASADDVVAVRCDEEQSRGRNEVIARVLRQGGLDFGRGVVCDGCSTAWSGSPVLLTQGDGVSELSQPEPGGRRALRAPAHSPVP